MPAPSAPTSPTAAVLIIGNEILSGRTQDINLAYIAAKLTGLGIRLLEARVVPDIEAEIADSLNLLRKRYTYVFTTGGIGPTHDDITVDSIAAAFGVDVVVSEEARARLLAHYGDPAKLTEARLRMARMPQGARLVDNPVSAAPGFAMENVYILAGVPNIMQAMLGSVLPGLTRGPAIHSVSVSGFVAESVIARELGEIAARHPALDIGSYPWVRDGKFGTALVTRGTDATAIQTAVDDITALVRRFDPAPEIEATPPSAA